MPTRNVVVTDHQHELIEALVASGRYQNASEVLREGLRLVEQREAEQAAKLRLLQQAAQAGFDDVANGRYVDITSAQDENRLWDSVNSEVDSRLAQRRR